MNTRFSNISEYLLQTLKNSLRGLLVRKVLVVGTDAAKTETQALVEPLIDYCREIGAEIDYAGNAHNSSETLLPRWMYDCTLVITDSTWPETSLFAKDNFLYSKKLANTLKAGGSLLVLSFNNEIGNKKNTLFQEMSKWINMLTAQAGLSMRMQDIHESCIIILFRKS